MNPLGLKRALWISTALLVALGAAAFWPAPRWAPPPRPVLRAPIVFDELVSHTPPPSEPNAAP
jgi:hypothetical protein